MTKQDHLFRGKLYAIAAIGIVAMVLMQSNIDATAAVSVVADECVQMADTCVELETAQPKPSNGIHACADEEYVPEYDSDGWATRGYMSAAELRGEHIKDGATRQRFYKRKAQVQRDFVDTMSAKALDICKDSDVPPSILVAQAYLESAFGTSRLKHQANNFFGHMYKSSGRGVVGKIKARDKNIRGKVKTYYFRVYESPWWSMRNHLWILEGMYSKRKLEMDIPEREKWMAALCACETTEMTAKESLMAHKKKGAFLYAAGCTYTASDGKTSRYVAELRYIIRLFHLEKLDEQWESQH